MEDPRCQDRNNLGPHHPFQSPFHNKRPKWPEQLPTYSSQATMSCCSLRIAPWWCKLSHCRGSATYPPSGLGNPPSPGAPKRSESSTAQSARDTFKKKISMRDGVELSWFCHRVYNVYRCLGVLSTNPLDSEPGTTRKNPRLDQI